MNRTLQHLEKMADILNSSPAVQEQMKMLAKKAEENNLTDEQWSEVKQRIMITLFYKMAERIPEIRDDLGADIYESLRAE